MFHDSVGGRGKTIASILIGLLFCVIIWTSPDAAAEGFKEDISTPVLIIDPGHGGEDGGAVSLSGTLESDINLDIALKLRELCSFLGISSVMTRECQEIPYPDSADTTAQRKRWDTQQRVSLIHATPNPILLSIHQNIYPAAAPSGSQVLYGPYDNSEHFGKLLHQNLIAALNPMNRRVAVPADNDIYIMAHSDCTAALVECGFLSNPEESVLLDTDSYRLKIAAVLAGTVLQYWEDTYESKDSVLLHRMRQ